MSGRCDDDDWFVVDPTGGKQRTIKRLLQKKRELKAEIAVLNNRINLLLDTLKLYRCDCPEYVRDSCTKPRCGSDADEHLLKYGL